MADLIVLLILATGVAWSILKKKLTVPAALTGALLGWLMYAGGGLTGLGMMTSFFILGTAATSFKRKFKSPFKPLERPDNMRNAGQVLANAGVASLIALLAILVPGYRNFLQMMMAAAFAAATSDTLSSELGLVYGKRHYNILQLKPDQKGLDGVISLEGTLIGVAGAALIAVVYAAGYHDWSAGPILIITIAGTIGNLADSILGASLERAGVLTNDGVNFFNTLTAALVAGALAV